MTSATALKFPVAPGSLELAKGVEDLFSSVLSQLKKYRPSGNLKFYNLSIFQNLKLRI